MLAALQWGLLTEDQRARLEVVLVSPRNPLNIGAVARAMANFGFARLKVVAPYEPHWQEARSAVGAEALLGAAVRRRRWRRLWPVARWWRGRERLPTGNRSREWFVCPIWAAGGAGDGARRARRAGVWAGETWADAGRSFLLPSAGGDSDGCAAALDEPGAGGCSLFYELAARGSGDGARGEAGALGPTAAAERLELLAGVVEEAMLAADYSPKAMQAANRHDLRLLLRRLGPTERDLRRILGLFRRILWRLER